MLVLGSTGVRASELTSLMIVEYQAAKRQRALKIIGKGSRERLVDLHPRAEKSVDE